MTYYFIFLTRCFLVMITFSASSCISKKNFFIGGVFSRDMQYSPSYGGLQFAANRLYNKNKTLSKLFKDALVVELVDDITDNYQVSSAICRLVSRGVVAIFGPIHFKTINMIMTLTDHFEVVYFTHSDVIDYNNVDATTSSEKIPPHNKYAQGKFIFHLRPVLASAINDFIVSQDWQRIFYLYDTKEALSRLRNVFEEFNRNMKSLSADPRFIEDSPYETMIIIKNFSSEEKKRIVLDITNTNIMRMLLDEMRLLRGQRANYDYFIMGVDINEVDLKHFKFGGVNITGLTMIDYKTKWIKDFVKNEWFHENRLERYPILSDEHNFENKIIPFDAGLMIDGVNVLGLALAITQQSSLSGAARLNHEACVPSYSPKFTAESLTHSIKKIAWPGLTGFLRFDENAYRKDFNVSIVQIGMKSNKKEIGKWNWNGGSTKLLFHSDQSIPSNYYDFTKNITRIVTSILSQPFLMERDYTVDGRPLVANDRYEGFCSNLTEIVARRLNFKYIIRPVKDGAYGSEINGTWNGMIGELVEEEAHLAVAPLTIISSREKVVDFSKPFMEVGLSIMYVKPEVKEKDVFSFMRPLSTEIWMCIAFAYLGVSVVLFLVSRFCPYEWNFNGDCQNAKISNDFSIFNSFWFSLSAFMQQGSDISPRSLSGRIVGSVWWFFTLIIVSSYTANLAAFLTVERMSSTIRSYEDLAKQSKIKYGVVNSGSSKEFFRTSTLETFKRMWHVMQTNPSYFVSSIEEGYERVKHSNRDYAFFLESSMNEYYQTLLPCTTTKVGPNLDSGKGYGIATPSGSDLREAVNLEVLELKEMNKIDEFYVDWWKKRSQCQESNEEEKTGSTSALGLSKVWGLFYILFGGFFFGILLSIVEFFYRCILESRRRKCPFKKVFFEMLTLIFDSQLPNSSSASKLFQMEALTSL